ncbi:hypothetical protein RM844_15405 [Streptomyces sp. DSM 44915]|uniref:Uncharacterized protein n=1 Tax=Streptomyces chisholmiae TaxID=3075540 RepID=A0ABU2JSH8_9ACTN|nr:hypothetical protein [Streptomyces sp. DSM 44915]MDT0267673.1 hypothetical protein [Streptomyces sp. DSM 44915]
MARDPDWSALNLEKDPTPGSPGEIDIVLDSHRQLISHAQRLDAGLTVVMSPTHGDFVGASAEALRDEVEQRLVNFVRTFRTGHEQAHAALERFQQVMVEEQEIADGALAEARELEKDDPRIEVLTRRAQEAGERLAAAGDVAAAEIELARDAITSPVKHDACKEFWDFFLWFALAISVVGIMFGGGFGLAAFLVNIGVLVGAVFGSALGKLNPLEIVFGLLGIMAMTTRAAVSFRQIGNWIRESARPFRHSEAWKELLAKVGRGTVTLLTAPPRLLVVGGISLARLVLTGLDNGAGLLARGWANGGFTGVLHEVGAGLLASFHAGRRAIRELAHRVDRGLGGIPSELGRYLRLHLNPYTWTGIILPVSAREIRGAVARYQGWFGKAADDAPTVTRADWSTALYDSVVRRGIFQEFRHGFEWVNGVRVDTRAFSKSPTGTVVTQADFEKFQPFRYATFNMAGKLGGLFVPSYQSTPGGGAAAGAFFQGSTTDVPHFVPAVDFAFSGRGLRIGITDTSLEAGGIRNNLVDIPFGGSVATRQPVAVAHLPAPGGELAAIAAPVLPPNPLGASLGSGRQVTAVVDWESGARLQLTYQAGQLHIVPVGGSMSDISIQVLGEVRHVPAEGLTLPASQLLTPVPARNAGDASTVAGRSTSDTVRMDLHVNDAPPLQLSMTDRLINFSIPEPVNSRYALDVLGSDLPSFQQAIKRSAGAPNLAPALPTSLDRYDALGVTQSDVNRVEINTGDSAVSVGLGKGYSFSPGLSETTTPPNWREISGQDLSPGGSTTVGGISVHRDGTPTLGIGQIEFHTLGTSDDALRTALNANEQALPPPGGERNVPAGTGLHGPPPPVLGTDHPLWDINPSVASWNTLRTLGVPAGREPSLADLTARWANLYQPQYTNGPDQAAGPVNPGRGAGVARSPLVAVPLEGLGGLHLVHGSGRSPAVVGVGSVSRNVVTLEGGVDGADLFLVRASDESFAAFRSDGTRHPVAVREVGDTFELDWNSGTWRFDQRGLRVHGLAETVLGAVPEVGPVVPRTVTAFPVTGVESGVTGVRRAELVGLGRLELQPTGVGTVTGEGGVVTHVAREVVEGRELLAGTVIVRPVSGGGEPGLFDLSTGARVSGVEVDDLVDGLYRVRAGESGWVVDTDTGVVLGGAGRQLAGAWELWGQGSGPRVLDDGIERVPSPAEPSPVVTPPVPASVNQALDPDLTVPSERGRGTVHDPDGGAALVNRSGLPARHTLHFPADRDPFVRGPNGVEVPVHRLADGAGTGQPEYLVRIPGHRPVVVTQDGTLTRVAVDVSPANRVADLVTLPLDGSAPRAYRDHMPVPVPVTRGPEPYLFGLGPAGQRAIYDLNGFVMLTERGITSGPLTGNFLLRPLGANVHPRVVTPELAPVPGVLAVNPFGPGHLVTMEQGSHTLSAAGRHDFDVVWFRGPRGEASGDFAVLPREGGSRFAELGRQDLGAGAVYRGGAAPVRLTDQVTAVDNRIFRQTDAGVVTVYDGQGHWIGSGRWVTDGGWEGHALIRTPSGAYQLMHPEIQTAGLRVSELPDNLVAVEAWGVREVLTTEGRQVRVIEVRHPRREGGHILVVYPPNGGLVALRVHGGADGVPPLITRMPDGTVTETHGGARIHLHLPSETWIYSAARGRFRWHAQRPPEPPTDQVVRHAADGVPELYEGDRLVLDSLVTELAPGRYLVETRGGVPWTVGPDRSRAFVDVVRLRSGDGSLTGALAFQDLAGGGPAEVFRPGRGLTGEQVGAAGPGQFSVAGETGRTSDVYGELGHLEGRGYHFTGDLTVLLPTTGNPVVLSRAPGTPIESVRRFGDDGLIVDRADLGLVTPDGEVTHRFTRLDRRDEDLFVLTPVHGGGDPVLYQDGIASASPVTVGAEITVRIGAQRAHYSPRGEWLRDVYLPAPGSSLHELLGEGNGLAFDGPGGPSWVEGPNGARVPGSAVERLNAETFAVTVGGRRGLVNADGGLTGHVHAVEPVGDTLPGGFVALPAEGGRWGGRYDAQWRPVLALTAFDEDGPLGGLSDAYRFGMWREDRPPVLVDTDGVPSPPDTSLTRLAGNDEEEMYLARVGERYGLVNEEGGDSHGMVELLGPGGRGTGLFASSPLPEVQEFRRVFDLAGHVWVDDVVAEGGAVSFGRGYARFEYGESDGVLRSWSVELEHGSLAGLQLGWTRSDGFATAPGLSASWVGADHVLVELSGSRFLVGADGETAVPAVVLTGRPGYQDLLVVGGAGGGVYPLPRTLDGASVDSPVRWDPETGHLVVHEADGTTVRYTEDGQFVAEGMGTGGRPELSAAERDLLTGLDRVRLAGAPPPAPGSHVYRVFVQHGFEPAEQTDVVVRGLGVPDQAAGPVNPGRGAGVARSPLVAVPLEGLGGLHLVHGSGRSPAVVGAGSVSRNVVTLEGGVDGADLFLVRTSDESFAAFRQDGTRHPVAVREVGETFELDWNSGTWRFDQRGLRVHGLAETVLGAVPEVGPVVPRTVTAFPVTGVESGVTGVRRAELVGLGRLELQPTGLGTVTGEGGVVTHVAREVVEGRELLAGTVIVRPVSGGGEPGLFDLSTGARVSGVEVDDLVDGLYRVRAGESGWVVDRDSGEVLAGTGQLWGHGVGPRALGGEPDRLPAPAEPSAEVTPPVSASVNQGLDPDLTVRGEPGRRTIHAPDGGALLRERAITSGPLRGNVLLAPLRDGVRPRVVTSELASIPDVLGVHRFENRYLVAMGRDSHLLSATGRAQDDVVWLRGPGGEETGEFTVLSRERFGVFGEDLPPAPVYRLGDEVVRLPGLARANADQIFRVADDGRVTVYGGQGDWIGSGRFVEGGSWEGHVLIGTPTGRLQLLDPDAPTAWFVLSRVSDDLVSVNVAGGGGLLTVEGRHVPSTIFVDPTDEAAMIVVARWPNAAPVAYRARNDGIGTLVFERLPDGTVTGTLDGTRFHFHQPTETWTFGNAGGDPLAHHRHLATPPTDHVVRHSADGVPRLYEGDRPVPHSHVTELAPGRYLVTVARNLAWTLGPDGSRAFVDVVRFTNGEGRLTGALAFQDLSGRGPAEVYRPGLGVTGEQVRAAHEDMFSVTSVTGRFGDVYDHVGLPQGREIHYPGDITLVVPLTGAPIAMIGGRQSLDLMVHRLGPDLFLVEGAAGRSVVNLQGEVTHDFVRLDRPGQDLFLLTPVHGGGAPVLYQGGLRTDHGVIVGDEITVLINSVGMRFTPQGEWLRDVRFSSPTNPLHEVLGDGRGVALDREGVSWVEDLHGARVPGTTVTHYADLDNAALVTAGDQGGLVSSTGYLTHRVGPANAGSVLPDGFIARPLDLEDATYVLDAQRRLALMSVPVESDHPLLGGRSTP